MSDKELLELAAKAAGFGDEFGVAWTETEYPRNSGFYGALWNGFGHGETAELWNPLTDDGDAFRLAVKLNLHVDANELECVVFIHGNFWKDEDGEKVTCKMIEEVHGTDPLTATRRAIVLAAAEIGRTK